MKALRKYFFLISSFFFSLKCKLWDLTCKVIFSVWVQIHSFQSFFQMGPTSVTLLFKESICSTTRSKFLYFLQLTPIEEGGNWKKQHTLPFFFV